MAYRYFVTARYIRLNTSNYTYSSYKNYLYEIDKSMVNKAEIGIIGNLDGFSSKLIEITGRFRVDDSLKCYTTKDTPSKLLTYGPNETFIESYVIPIKKIKSFEPVAKVKLIHNKWSFEYDYKPKDLLSFDLSLTLRPNGYEVEKPLLGEWGDTYGSLRDVGPHTFIKLDVSEFIELEESLARLRKVVEDAPVFSGECTYLDTIDNSVQTIRFGIKNENKENTNINNREENNMNIFNNVDFGKATGFAYSPKGIAIKTDTGYMGYDFDSNSITDVSNFVMDIGDFFYKIPVAISDISCGDLIIHKGRAMYVTEVCSDDGTLYVVDPFSSEVRVILPVKNIFNFNYYTKVVSLMPMGNMFKMDEKNPFGNLMPFLLMKDMDTKNGTDPLMLMLLMNNLGEIDFMSNPMMMYLLCKDDKKTDDALPFFLMGNNFRGTTGSNNCNCVCNCATEK